jgi:spermidine synthase
MPRVLKRYLLPFTVFVTGACVLVIEILATRILAPYFGNTIYSVSSVISVVLAALSGGYYVGGHLADRHPSKKLFFAIIAFSGLLVLLMQIVQDSLLPLLGYRLPLDVGPLIMSLILFFVPSFVLGLLSPFAVVLQQRDAKRQGLGTTAGEIFFFSTVGSIAGSLLAGFALIPFFGIQAIISGVGIVLFLLGIVPLAVYGVGRRLIVCLTLATGAALLLAAIDSPASRGVVYSRDGVYEKIVIAEGIYRGRPVRTLSQDTSNSAAMYLDSDELTYDYTKYYALYSMFMNRPERVLSIGGGAYSVPKALLADLPGTLIDTSEIEPSLIDLSRQYFNLQDDPRLTHYIKDGRRMLHDSPHRYDVIFSDVYHSMYSIPSHFTTREFMQLASDRLTGNGVFIANIIGSLRPGDRSFLWSEVKTMQQVFAQVYVFAVNSPTEEGVQNTIVVGSKSPQRLDVHDPKWRRSPYDVVRTIAGHYVATERMDLDRYLILTDNYAPVDYLASRLLPKR